MSACVRQCPQWFTVIALPPHHSVTAATALWSRFESSEAHEHFELVQQLVSSSVVSSLMTVKWDWIEDVGLGIHKVVLSTALKPRHLVGNTHVLVLLLMMRSIQHVKPHEKKVCRQERTYFVSAVLWIKPKTLAVLAGTLTELYPQLTWIRNKHL